MTVNTKAIPSSKSDINVTPLIDVLLVLLIIFMVISPFQTRGLDARVPQPPEDKETFPPMKAPDSTLVITVEADHTLRLNQELVLKDTLGERLGVILKSRSDRTLFLQGANSLLFADIADIIDIAKGAGADRIGLMTQRI